MSVFSPLAKGYGTLSGELQPAKHRPPPFVKSRTTLPILSHTPPPEDAHRHGITVTPRAKSAMSCFTTPKSAREATAYEDGELVMPKTYITRKGALVLFSAPDGFEKQFYEMGQPQQNDKLLKNRHGEYCNKIGSISRLAQSVLMYGDEDGYNQEETSITDPENKAFLRFMHDQDNQDQDMHAKPGYDIEFYLSDLKRKFGIFMRSKSAFASQKYGLYDSGSLLSSRTSSSTSLEDNLLSANADKNKLVGQFVRPGSQKTRADSPSSNRSGLSTGLSNIHTSTPQPIADSIDLDVQPFYTYDETSGITINRSVLDEFRSESGESFREEPILEVEVTSRKSSTPVSRKTSAGSKPAGLKSGTHSQLSLHIEEEDELNLEEGGLEGQDDSISGAAKPLMPQYGVFGKSPEAESKDASQSSSKDNIAEDADASKEEEVSGEVDKEEVPRAGSALSLQSGDKLQEVSQENIDKSVNVEDSVVEEESKSRRSSVASSHSGCSTARIDHVRQGDTIQGQDADTPRSTSPAEQNEEEKTVEETLHDCADITSGLDEPTAKEGVSPSPDQSTEKLETSREVQELEVSKDTSLATSTTEQPSEDVPMIVNIEKQGLKGESTESLQNVTLQDKVETNQVESPSNNLEKADIENVSKESQETIENVPEVVEIKKIETPTEEQAQLQPMPPSEPKPDNKARLRVKSSGNLSESSGYKTASAMSQGSAENLSPRIDTSKPGVEKSPLTKSVTSIPDSVSTADFADPVTQKVTITPGKETVTPVTDSKSSIGSSITEQKPAAEVCKIKDDDIKDNLSVSSSAKVKFDEPIASKNAANEPKTPVPEDKQPVTPKEEGKSAKTQPSPARSSSPLKGVLKKPQPQKQYTTVLDITNYGKDDEKDKVTAPPSPPREPKTRTSTIPKPSKPKKETKSTRPSVVRAPSPSKASSGPALPEPKRFIAPIKALEKEERDIQKEEEALKKLNEEVDNILTTARTAEEEDEEVAGGLTVEELELEAQLLKEKMAEAENKIHRRDAEAKAAKRPKEAKKGGKGKKKAVPQVDEVEAKREALKEAKRLEKEKRLAEAQALEEKVKAQEEQQRQIMDSANRKKADMEAHLQAMREEAEEAEMAEDEARAIFAESRKQARIEREQQRKEEIERKKQYAIQKKEEERRRIEAARQREMEMLMRLADAEERRKMEEDEAERREEEERLLQIKIEEEERALRMKAEEEEERIRELERQAEEEAMTRVISEREEANRRKRLMEEEARKLAEQEELLRLKLEEEQKRLDEERRKYEESEKQRQEAEKKRLAELQRLEEEVRDKMRQEMELRREALLRRRELNLERKNFANALKGKQGITRPWVFTYYVHWPRETYDKKIGGEENKKKGFRPKPKPKAS